jgi:hypothetical protein
VNPLIGKLIENLGITKRDLIKSIIAEFFFADFGTVKAVHGSPPTAVDVQHSVQPQLFGQQLETTVTKGIELLFIGGGAGMSFEWDVNQGDPVLLIGLRDIVSAANPVPAPPGVTLHYTQETMKAIPLGPFKAGASFVIKVTGGVAQLAGSTYAMTLYENLNTSLQTFLTALKAAVAAGCAGGSGGTLGALSLDISSAQSSKVKAGG